MGFPREKAKARRVAPSKAGVERVSKEDDEMRHMASFVRNGKKDLDHLCWHDEVGARRHPGAAAGWVAGFEAAVPAAWAKPLWIRGAQRRLGGK